MTDSLFKSIIQQLHEMNYKGCFVLNIFNEPLLDPSLSEKISSIREMLPDVWILFNSNGDFLNTELLNKLYAAGLNQIIVTLHTLPNQPYEISDRRNAIEKFLNKLKLENYFDKRVENSDRNIILDIVFSETEKLFIRTSNWQVYGNDRGGTLKNLRSSLRTAPCTNPFREIFIAYDGTVKSCCNIYFNCANIYGNANENLLTDIYFGEELCNFRRELFTFSRKSGGCATCNTEDNAQVSEQAERKNILSRCGLE